MRPTIPSAPWYRHRWPWFILALLGGSITATLTMVTLAARQADALVTDHYYEAGKGISRSLERERLALRLKLTATLRLDALTGEAVLVLKGDSQPEQLQLNLTSPTRPEKDLHLSLRHASNGRYVGHLDAALKGRRFIELLGQEQGQPWRLFEEEWVRPDTSLTLGDEALQGVDRP